MLGGVLGRGVGGQVRDGEGSGGEGSSEWGGGEGSSSPILRVRLGYTPLTCTGNSTGGACGRAVQTRMKKYM